MALKPTLAAAAVAFVVSAGASQLLPGGGAAPTLAAASPASAPSAGTTMRAILDDLDLRIERLETRVAARDDDWLTRMHLGNALLERATITHRLDDYARVEALLDESFAIAPEGSGPLLLAARFSLAVHRLDDAERWLDAIDARAVPRRDELVLARILRGQIAMQRGSYEDAIAAFEQCAKIVPSVAEVELALAHAKLGDLVRAESMLQSALAAAPAKDPRRRAWLRLQLGILELDRGAPLLAAEHLEAADAEVRGWWLVQEHLARAYDRLGDHGRAIAIYESLLASTDLPQHMDALAIAYRHAGREAEAISLVARATQRWDEQMRRFPESAVGHALQHHLQLGSPTRAVELARANRANRPGGDAEVALARALLKVGEPAEALAVAERTLGTRYRTAGLHDVAAKAHAALGHEVLAAQQIALRAALNPSYTDDDHAH
jgi:tetratricopeptide (TPR) repeat protein